MTTSAEVIEAAAAAAKLAMEKRVTSFRQNDSSATFATGNQIASLLETLADANVQAAINASSSSTIRKFSPICA